MVVRREESGFMLVELLVAAGLLLIVLGAVLALLDPSSSIDARPGAHPRHQRSAVSPPRWLSLARNSQDSATLTVGARGLRTYLASLQPPANGPASG